MTRLTLPVLLSGSFMVVLDFFIVMVALPSIQADLACTADTLQFIVAGYGVANAAALISGGRLGDMYGRRRMFITGLALFTVASTICGLAPNASTLIAARVAQGLAGALLQPQVLSLLGTLYVGANRPRAFATYALALGVAGVSGQLVGGALIHLDLAHAGWRNCFLVNVPIGLVGLTLARHVIPKIEGAGRSRLDVVGALLISATLVAIVLPLVQGRQQGWPLWSVLSIALVVPLVCIFAVQQRQLARQGGQPVLAPQIFAHKSFFASVVATVVFYSGIASFYFVLALHLQRDLGLSPLTAGLMFAVLGVGFLCTSLLAASVSRRFSDPVVLGALVLSVGHAMQLMVALLVAGTCALAWLLPCLLIEGAGIGLVMAPLVSNGLKRLPQDHAGAGAGLLATAQQVGNAVGVALIGFLFYGCRAVMADLGVLDEAYLLCLGYLIVVALGVAALQRHGLSSSTLLLGPRRSYPPNRFLKTRRKSKTREYARPR